MISRRHPLPALPAFGITANASAEPSQSIWGPPTRAQRSSVVRSDASLLRIKFAAASAFDARFTAAIRGGQTES